jgi:hypothetical protein
VRPLTILAFACASVALAACGSNDEATTTEDASQPAPAASDFPPAKGATLDRVLAANPPTDEIVVSPAGQVYTPGPNRFGFGVFTVAGEQITDAEVALYAAPARGGGVKGPNPASIESLETDPAFEARTTADDPDSARVVYRAEVDFDRPGEWRLVALVRRGEELAASRLPSVMVGDYAKIPAVGAPAPDVHTPTTAEVGDVAEICTRDPHDTMHDTDLAEAIGKKPTVLLFATPALCVSRVCGPVVDVAEQVKSGVGDDAAFIHMEVYEENNPNEGIRPQLASYGLRTEPWLFVLDAQGRVSTRIEGAFSVEELRAAIQKAG